MDEIFEFVGNPAGAPGKHENFDGGDGNDTLDAFFDGETAFSPVVTDFVDHGDGTFTATYRSTQGGDGADSVTITNIENVRIVLRNAYDFDGGVIQDPQPDIIRTGGGDDYIETRGGNDIIDSGKGVDVVDGGGDIDVISKDFSDVSVDILWNIQTGAFSGPGNFIGLEGFGVLRTGSGNDDIVTGSFTNASAAPGDETVHTGAGNDQVTVSNGIDHVTMGAGDDRLVLNYLDASFPGSVVSILTQNSDGSYSGEHRGVAGSGLRTGVTFENVEHFTIILPTAGGNGGNLNDTIRTGDGNDVIHSGASSDLIYAGRGVDEVDGGETGTDVDGLAKEFDAAGAAVDINLDANTYSGPGLIRNIEYFIDLKTSDGNDVVVTSSARDSTGGGNDRIDTRGGDDMVTLFNGNDTVDLGAGNDRLVIDYATYNPFTGGTAMTLTETSSGTYSGTLDTNRSELDVTFVGVEHFTIHTTVSGGNGSNLQDDIVTGAGDDIVSTYASDDRINVGTGIDSVDGGSGADGLAKEFGAGAPAIDINLDANSFSGLGSYTNLEWFIELGTGDGGDVVVTSSINNTSSGAGDDTIFTRGGDDVVTLFAGNDTVDMGAGEDRLVIDLAAYNGFVFGTTWTLTETEPGTYSGVADGGSTSFDVTFAGVEHFTFYGNSTGGNGSNSIDNVTTGDGDDIIFTYHSNDTVNAGGGNDIIDGGAGNDIINGGFGNDYIDGGSQSDSLAGGDGHDTLAYATATAGVRISLALTSAQATGGSGTDTISGFEDLVGSSHDDDLTGDAAANRIDGGGGNDFILGGDGDDELIGGSGRDTTSYSTAGAAVTVSLADGTATGGGGTDTLDGFEKIVGSAFNDTLTGDAGGNRIEGGGGDDLLDAGAGSDTAAYEFAASGVQVSLSIAGPQDTVGAGIDTLIGFEHLFGSAHADQLTGDGGANNLDGSGGADVMTGLGGNDTYVVDHAGDQTVENAGGGHDRVKSFATYTIGDNIENLFLVGNAAIDGTGNALANSIFGNNAANRIDGGAGADQMSGGGGNDTYFVDQAGDQVIEYAGGGVDLVISSVSRLLFGNVENLTLTGTADLLGIGNELANSMTGNSGNNSLDGRGGADVMRGLGGNDTYFVDDAADAAIEAAGEGHDRVKSSVSYVLGANIENLFLLGSDAIDGTGNAEANAIFGTDAANVLDGAGGADKLTGGRGDDTYVIDHVGDRIVEYAGQGIDAVRSSISFTLGATLEHLVLTGTADIFGTGNDLANEITGNAGDNVLNGNGGADRMEGLAGNDTYFVDDAGDVVIEADPLGGTDLVRSSIAFTLGDHVENLRLIGSDDIDGTGNGLANEIVGNVGDNGLFGEGGDDMLSGSAGDDALHGGLGSDSLHGGGGADEFHFDAALGAGNVDTVLDMLSGFDAIVLDDAVFAALAPGALSADAFTIGTQATTAEHRIVYDSTTGALSYDADGSGAGAAIQFATMANLPSLSAADFLVI